MEQPQGLNGEVIFAVEGARIATADGAQFGYRRNLPVKMSVRIERIHRPARTVEHELTIDHLALSMTTSVWSNNGRAMIASSPGMMEDLHLVNGAISPEALGMLGIIADFHLNTMTAACVHQQLQVTGLRTLGETGSLLDEIDYCEEGDYHYGSAWLVRLLPSGMLNELRRIFADVDPALVYDSGEEE
jgi:hypothetical protein